MNARLLARVYIRVCGWVGAWQTEQFCLNVPASVTKNIKIAVTTCLTVVYIVNTTTEQPLIRAHFRMYSLKMGSTCMCLGPVL